MFTENRPFAGVTHITDSMGVSFTLLAGKKKAVLFDTGYGMENVAAHIETLTDKQVNVLLSHGHHDHILGARWFRQTRICHEDMKEFSVRTGIAQRIQVKKQAEECGVAVPQDFMETIIPIPDSICFQQKTGVFDSVTEDLGGMIIHIIRVPGHTPGSIVIHVPAYGLLLTGDNWNPCTWMWFPSSLSASQWRDNMHLMIRTLEQDSGKEISSVICSHQHTVRKGGEMKEFLDYMTDKRLREAPAIDMGTQIHTHQIRNESEEWTLIFDRDKVETES